jgi:pimeloyl-ACP methyl ester carboxylesterase
MEMPAEHDRREALTHPGNPETLMTSATSVRAHLRLLAIVAAAASLGAGALLALPASAAPAATIPSWYLVAGQDHAIAPAAERSMAKRAKAHTVEVNAPHAVYLTDPGAVTRIILDAAKR